MGVTTAVNVTGVHDSSMDVGSVTLAVQIFPVVFLLAGIVGNVVTIVALFRCKMLGSGSRVYHTNLCLLDLGAVLLSTLRLWLLALVPLDLASVHPVLCRVWPWLESAALTAQPWILVAMIMQVQEGLRKSHAPGANISRWKSLVYSAAAVLTALVFNCLRIFTYSLHQRSDGDSLSTGTTLTGDPNSINSSSSRSSSATRTTTGVAAAATDASPQNNSGGGSGSDDDCTCSPTTPDLTVFFSAVWPWLSLMASLLIPVLIAAAGFCLIMYRVCTRCRHAGSVSSPPKFTALTVSVQVLACFSVLTSLLLCGICLADPRRFWAEYAETMMKASAAASGGGDGEGGGEGYAVSCVFRLVFQGQFALRWFVTCFTCRLWPVVAAMCRRTSEGR